MKRIRNELGVAMTTVLIMGATLTVLASTATFVTVQELRAGTDERKSAEALAYAEAGIDRFMNYLASSNPNYAQLVQAGCEQPAISLPTGTIGNGTFTVSMQVYDPTATSEANRLPQPPSGGACTTAPTGTRNKSNPRKGQYFLITSTGEHPASKRVVQEVVKVATRGLPVGMVGDNFNLNGTPDVSGMSIVTQGAVTGRDKLDMTGIDPYYTLGDFWPDATWSGGLSASSPAPVAAHAIGGLKMTNSSSEFPPNPNCSANKSNANKQSLWDSDGSPGSGPLAVPASTCLSAQPAGYVGAYPNTSKFTQEDLDRVAQEDLSSELDADLKRAAQQTGLYCYKATSAAWSCTRQGVTVGGSPATDLAPIYASGTKDVVAYYEFQSLSSANTVSFPDSSSWTDPTGCSTSSTVNRTLVLRVKNGGVGVTGSTRINGAVLVDGAFDYTGAPKINGSVMATDVYVRGGGQFTLDACWVASMPFSYLAVTPTQWSEVDR
jgi:hypothetical protein